MKKQENVNNTEAGGGCSLPACSTLVLSAGEIVKVNGIPVRLKTDTEIECHPANVGLVITQHLCGSADSWA